MMILNFIFRYAIVSAVTAAACNSIYASWNTGAVESITAASPQTSSILFTSTLDVPKQANIRGTVLSAFTFNPGVASNTGQSYSVEQFEFCIGSNYSGTYTLEVLSANSGMSNGTDTLPYELVVDAGGTITTYTQTGGNFGTINLASDSIDKCHNGASPTFGIHNNLSLKYNNWDLLPLPYGTYSDTLTLTITGTF